jgi:hypothetical protein
MDGSLLPYYFAQTFDTSAPIRAICGQSPQKKPAQTDGFSYQVLSRTGF